MIDETRDDAEYFARLDDAAVFEQALDKHCADCGNCYLCSCGVEGYCADKGGFVDPFASVFDGEQLLKNLCGGWNPR